MTGPESDSEESEDSDQLPQRPTSLRPDQVWVEYHPAARKRPEIICSGTPYFSPSPPPAIAPATLTAWHPFRTREDFEQAEIFVRFEASNPQMDDQLNLIRRSAISGSTITLKNAREVHETLARVPLASAMPNTVRPAAYQAMFSNSYRKLYPVRKSCLQRAIQR